MKFIKIRVKGIVQGVGFRPFIYRIAHELNLTGNVINDTQGVLINAGGKEEEINTFLKKIREKSPPLAYVQEIIAEELPPFNDKEFAIGESKTSDKRSTFIAPDTAVCGECLTEFFNGKDRRFHYPFITCTNCGPRFSIVNDIPYDRKNTTMSAFRMCDECSHEYTHPLDRRFHTQPNACGVCGPELSLYSPDGKGMSINPDMAAHETVRLLREGNIIAIKGVGGYLLAADAKSDNVLKILRQRKARPFKPFALMAANIEKIKEFLYVNETEERILLSKERPIVLLKTKKQGIISPLAAPSLSYTGIMLPYMPFQHHIFSLDKDMILVMTSGNISDEPIIFRDNDAFRKLAGIADYFVVYNREISSQTDDSVVFVEDNKLNFIRRSRGYVPVPFRSATTERQILATGGDLKNSFALAKDDIIIMSQHLGDLSSPAGNELFRNTIEHFKRVYDFSPDMVISDMHPSYFTTQFADELEEAGLERKSVQHHHAHIAGVMEEHGLDERVIGIAYDGTGFGTDGTLWGSEFLIAGRDDFLRAGHFSYFPLPGGESAIKEVWKIGLSLLHRRFGWDIPVMGRSPGSGFDRLRSGSSNIVLEIIEKKINSPLTCSIGRIFDGISAILGISETISTEAEAAMLLEEAAQRGKKSFTGSTFEIPFIQTEDKIIIQTEEITEYIVSLIMKKEPVDNIAYAFHVCISDATVKTAAMLRDMYNINKVALSGGVFQNRLLLNMITKGLAGHGFEVYTHRNVPANDGCISLGQLAIAKEII